MQRRFSVIVKFSACVEWMKLGAYFRFKALISVASKISRST